MRDGGLLSSSLECSTFFIGTVSSSMYVINSLQIFLPLSLSLSSVGRIRNSFKPCHTHFLVVFTSDVCKWGLGASGVTASAWMGQEDICCHTGGEGGRRWLSLAQSDGRAPPRCATWYHICGSLHKACVVASPPGWMRLTGWGSSHQPRALPGGSWWPPHNGGLRT